MPRNTANQLKPEYQSLQNQNNFAGNDSASRKQMASGNYGQAVTLIQAMLRDFPTGTEVEYGKYQFNNKMPATAIIIDVIEDIVPSSGRGGLTQSPSKLVIYEDVDTGRYGSFTMPTYISHHKLFGVPLHPTTEGANLRPGQALHNGTVLNTTSDHHENGEIMVGRPARIGFITLPGVTEDSTIISDRAAEEFGFWCYEKRTFSIGREYWPENIYGGTNPGDPYQFAPNIGEFVGKNGTLVALRKRAGRWASLDMTRARTRSPYRSFDRIIRATPGAEVVNVEVFHDGDQKQTNLPTEVATYIERYDAAKRRRNARLIDLYKRLEKEHNGRAPMTREFHAEIKRALNYNNPLGLPGRRLCYKKDDIDEYRITITFRYRLKAGMAVKSTDFHGGKGVIGEVRRWQDMPTDQHGRPLDFVVDPMSLTKRMNLGKVIEPRLSSTTLEYTRLLRADLGLPDEPIDLTIARGLVEQMSVEWRDQWFTQLQSLYKLLSPWQHEFLTTYNAEDIIDHLTHAVGIRVRPWLPTNNPVVYSDAHKELRENHPVNKGVMTFNTHEGIPVTTVDEMVSGNIYQMVLEKIGRDLSGVSSTRILSNGVPGKMSSSEKGTGHIRSNAVRLPSETDLRWMLMAMGGTAIRDLQERGNSPEIHEVLYESILTADNPMDIASAIPRDRFDMNHNRIGKQVRQLQMCNGVKISKVPTPTVEEVQRERASRA